MSIQTQIERLTDAKAALKTAIEQKGVAVPEGAPLEQYAPLVEQIVGDGEKDFSLIRKIEITSPEQQVVSFEEDISDYSEIIIKGIPVSESSGQLQVMVKKDSTIVCMISFGTIATDTSRNVFGVIRRTNYGFVMIATNQNHLNGAAATFSNNYGTEIPAGSNISVTIQNSTYGKKFIEGTEFYIYAR